MIEIFDRRRVSFVSVTQAFNTTTSMGRLTLNVLLSFAQFEREVTGERIRDKIAASKAKGMWMGGTVPNKPVTGLTGYDRWRADIDRLAETGQRIMDDNDTYASHLNGIPLGLEHMRWWPAPD